MSAKLCCPQCGSAVKADGRFCEQCGTRLNPMPAETQPTANEDAILSEANPTGTAKDGAIVWEYGIPVLTNPFMLWDMGRVVVISIAVMYALVFVMGWIAEGDPVLLPWELLAIIGGVFVVLFGIAGLLAYQNRFHSRFTVDADGVVTESGRKERRLNRISTFVGVLGLLSGRPGPLGSALIATSQEVTGIRWRDVHKVTVHNRLRVISLNDSWHTVQRLYCTEENFAQVTERVLSGFNEAEQWRISHPRKSRPINYRRYLFWAGLSILAGIAATAWETEEIIGQVIFGGVMVLLSGLVEGPLRRLLALLGMAAMLFYGYIIATIAFERTEFAGGYISWYGYEIDTGLLILAGGGALLLLGMSLWRLLGRDAEFNRGNERLQ